MKCPSCGGLTEIDNKSCSCGWKQRGAPEARVSRRCDWNDHGDQCEKYGHLSNSINGSGPWYCRNHFADLMKWPRVAEPTTNLPIN